MYDRCYNCAVGDVCLIVVTIVQLRMAFVQHCNDITPTQHCCIVSITHSLSTADRKKEEPDTAAAASTVRLALNC